MEDAKETMPSRHNTTDVHMNSQGLHNFKPVGVPALRRGGGYELPSLSKKLSPIDNHL